MSEVRNTDINMIQLAVHGNVEAFSALFEHYFEPVYNFALWLCNDPHAAEDLTQETFIRAHKNLHRLGPPWHVRSWLYRMARNLYVDTRRREPETNPLDPQAADLGSQNDPENHLMMSELSGPVRLALQRLSPSHRQALILREVEHMQYEDIAAVMGMSLGNVKVMLHRARSSFKDAYGVRLMMEEPLPDCRVLNELLDTLCDGESLGDQEARVRDHLKDCPTCQQRKRMIAALVLLFRGQPVLKPPQGAQSRVASALSRQPRIDPARRWGRLAAVAALEAAIILLIWLWSFMGLPNPMSASLPAIFGDGRGGGVDVSTATPAPAPSASPTAAETPTPTARISPAVGPVTEAACVPDPTDHVCSACENTDLDSTNCACNMNGVCDPQEGLNCPDCGPTAFPDGGGGSKCGCVCDVKNPQTKKCIQGHNSCTQQACLP
jgi:RNA polymerase sigma-70 factor (ECF subfamily)